MSQAWQALSGYVQAHVLAALLATGGAIFGLARLLLPHYLTKRVDARFDRQLESHKSELQRILEQDKFDLQRKLTAGSLYIQRQHDAAAKAYTAIRWAHGEIARLMGVEESRIQRDASRDDISELLDRYNTYGGKKAALLDSLDADREQGMIDIEAHIATLRAPRARAAMLKARNLVLENEIYFSEPTLKSFRAFNDLCASWCANVEMATADTVFPYDSAAADALNAALSAVKHAMRAELADPALVLGVSAPVPTATEEPKVKWLPW